MVTDVYKNESERHSMMTTIHRNVDLMSATTATIDALHSEMEAISQEPSQLVRIQDDVAKQLTALRKPNKH